MKLLLLDNSSITPIKDELYIDKKTGEFINELIELGIDVSIYGQIVKNENSSHTFPLKKNEIKVDAFKRKHSKLIHYLFFYLNIIPAIIKNDYIYIFFPTALQYVCIICWIFNKPFGLYIRGEKGVKSSYSKWAYKKADLVLTVSDYYTEYINKISKSNKANTIYPMIPFSIDDAIIDRKYKLSDRLRILFLGRITEDKGILELLDAIKILDEKGYKLQAKIVGDGSFMEQAQQLTFRLKINHIVEFTGMIDDSNLVKNQYLESDVFILPSYHEGFPRTLYEAMLFGTPIITTFVGTIPMIMKHHFNCLKIKPKSVSSIVESLTYTISNYPTMITYAINGTNTIRKTLSPNKLAHSLHFRKLLANENSH